MIMMEVSQYIEILGGKFSAPKILGALVGGRILYSKMNDSILGRDVDVDEEEDWFEKKQYDNLSLDSELQLSNISYLQNHESPSVNLNAAENKIKQLSKTAQTNVIKKTRPYCGCGQYYSCTSSLYLHIRSKHGGIPPKGTIGGPKGIVKKNYQHLQQHAVKIQDGHGNKFNYYPGVKQQEKLQAMEAHSNEKQVDPSAMLSQQISGQSKKSKGQSTTKTCKLCGKIYSCNSSLNLHLKRKHEKRRLEDGQIEYEARVEDRQPKNYQCSICGLNYGSKSALGLHYNNKHNARNGNNQLPYDEERIQKCGCGLIYQSRSALNMHVKKKHDGKYPEGTSQKPQMRSKGRTSQNFVMQPDQDDKQGIFDQDSEGYENAKKINRQNPPQRIFKCGCGRNYSCSSSLNLHIKKNHNWQIPKGTIGGPRSMRQLQDKDKEKEKIVQISNQQTPKVEKECDSCKGRIKIHPYYECSCDNHYLCKGCFWKEGHISDLEHRWEIIDKEK